MKQYVDFPCYNTWDELSDPDGSSKLCEECQTRVHSEPQSGLNHYCGTDTTAFGWPQTPGQFSRRFLVILLLAFGSSLFTNVHAQTGKKDSTVKEIVQDPIEIRGTVIDKENGERLPFVIVTISNGSDTVTAHTDFDGNYKMIIPDEWDVFSGQMEARYIGYDKYSREVTWAKGKQNRVDLELPVDDDLIIIGVVVPYDPPLIDKDPNAHRSTTLRRQDVWQR